MSLPAKLLTTLGFLILLVAIGVTDAFLTQPNFSLPALAGNQSSSAASDGTVPKDNGPDVFQVLNAQGLVTQAGREESLIRRIIPSETPVESRVLLRSNDRVAFFSWAESPNVKEYFTALKEALHGSFSSDLQDLVDENQERDGKPVRNVLSFVDPAIHEDRLLFIRVRQRIYEFHVSPDQEATVQTLMDALTE